MNNTAKFIRELLKILESWKMPQPDDRFDKLQELYDETRLDCATEVMTLLVFSFPDLFAKN